MDATRIFHLKRLLMSTALATAAIGALAPASAQDLMIDDVGGDAGAISENGFAISADGSTALGRNEDQLILWTGAGGFEPFDVPGVVFGLSGDGGMLVGAVQAANGRDSAFTWTATDGVVTLPYLSGDETDFIASAAATAVSDDGSVIVGRSNAGEAFNFNSHAVRWTNGVVESLGTLGDAGANAGSFAYGVSGDGSTIVGSSGEAGMIGNTAFRFTDAEGMVSLGRLNDGNGSEALAASFDGAVIVGYALDGAAFNASRAVRWTDAGGLEVLNAAGAYTAARANDVSADGSVIVGLLGTGEVTGPRAFRWTEETDAITIGDWLRNAGATIETDDTREAFGVSADGTVVVGQTQSGQMFIARAAESGGGDDGGEDMGEDMGDDMGGDMGGDDAGGDDAGDDAGDDGAGGDDMGGDDVGGDDMGGGDFEPGMITVDDLSESLGGASIASIATVAGFTTILNGAGSRPLDRRAPEDGSVFWVGGDWGRDDHGARDGEVKLGELGLGRNFGAVQINGVLGLTALEQNTALGGQTDVDAAYLKVEALSQLTGEGGDGLWLALAGVGLRGETDIARNYLDNGGLVDTSVGAADIDGHSLRARLQWEQEFNASRLAPYGELSHTRVCLDGYAETGGAFPASFGMVCDDTNELRLGMDLSVPATDAVRLIATAEGAHRIEDDGPYVTGQVIGLGGFSTGPASYEQDWARGGLGFELDIAGATFSLMGNVTTKGEAPSTWAAANLRFTR